MFSSSDICFSLFRTFAIRLILFVFPTFSSLLFAYGNFLNKCASGAIRFAILVTGPGKKKRKTGKIVSLMDFQSFLS